MEGCLLIKAAVVSVAKTYFGFYITQRWNILNYLLLVERSVMLDKPDLSRQSPIQNSFYAKCRTAASFYITEKIIGTCIMVHNAHRTLATRHVPVPALRHLTD